MTLEELEIIKLALTPFKLIETNDYSRLIETARKAREIIDKEIKLKTMDPRKG